MPYGTYGKNVILTRPIAVDRRGKPQVNVYENLWTWEGQTKKSSVTSAVALEPHDPFPFDDAKTACEIAILSELTPRFKEEFAKLGITITVTKIEPEVWIETKAECKPHGRWHRQCYWYHWLHMKANVYFTSDKPVTESPIAAVVISALTIILKHLITVIAVALVIYAIAKVFIESFFVETYTIKTYNPETGEWTEETWKKPKLGSAIALGAGLVIAAVLASVILSKRKS